MKSLLLILAASLLVTAFFRAVLRLLRANREEQRDTHVDVDTIEFGPGFDHSGNGYHATEASKPTASAGVITSVEQFQDLVGKGANPEMVDVVRHFLANPRNERIYVATADVADQAFREIVGGELPPPKLNPDLPPLDFGELPDVTEDAVESTARSLSERPKGAA